MSSEGLPKTRSEDLNVLSGIVSGGVRTYLDRLQQTAYPLPTLEDPIPEIVKDTAAQDAKLEIMRACERIIALVQGPVEWFMFQNMAFHESACVAVAIDLNIPEHVAPGPTPTSLSQLVELTGASSELIGKILDLPLHLLVHILQTCSRIPFNPLCLGVDRLVLVAVC